MSSFDDLLFLGARLTPAASLLEALLGPLPPGRAAELADLLRLRGPALACALEVDPDGPRLMAALELGRRSALPEASAEVRGPAEAAGLASRLWAQTDPAPTALVLDEGGRLARMRLFEDPRGALTATLAGGGAGLIVVAPEGWAGAEALSSACALVGCALVDVVWTSASGLVSAARSAAVPVRGWERPTWPS